jgi:hypothetical protein
MKFSYIPGKLKYLFSLGQMKFNSKKLVIDFCTGTIIENFDDVIGYTVYRIQLIFLF